VGEEAFSVPGCMGVVVPIVGFVGEGSGRKVCEEAIGIVRLFQDSTSLIETSLEERGVGKATGCYWRTIRLLGPSDPFLLLVVVAHVWYRQERW
jgi:hypothetical protein